MPLRYLSYVIVAILFCQSAEAQTGSRMMTGRAESQNRLLEAMANWNGDAKLVGEGWPTPPQNIVPKEGYLSSDTPVGTVADLAYCRFQVLQVLENNALLVTLGDVTYWVEGGSTSNISDGIKIRLASPVVFIEKKEYESVAGSKKIVKAIRLLSKKEFLERTVPIYTLSTGEEVQLIYKSTANKGHVFETLDGEEKTYSTSDFDENSRKLLKAAIDESKKAKGRTKR